MSRVTELEKALTTLFRKGTEVGYTETEIDPVVPADQEDESGHGQQAEGKAGPAVPLQPENEKDEGRQGGGGPQPGAAGKPGVQRGELPLAGGDAGPIQVGRQDRSALSGICQIPT